MNKKKSGLKNNPDFFEKILVNINQYRFQLCPIRIHLEKMQLRVL